MIPVKSSEIEITPFDNGGFLITHKTLNYRVNVNKTVIDLLELVDGKRTVNEIYQVFLKTFKKSITVDSVHQILFNELGKYHIIQNEKYEYQVIEKPNYLKLSATVLKKHWISPITKIMSSLFSKMIFYPILIICFVFITYIGITQYSSIVNGVESLRFSHLIFIFSISFITVIFHEFGHASACKKFGAEHGDIGFGFYLLSPVMYADVSDVWKLKRKERIIVNLGGLYMQILIASLFGVIFLFTKEIQYLLVLYMLGIVSVFINLNPFFRTDGYWILSDIIRVSNLRKTSNALLKDFSLGIIKRQRFDFSKQNILLLLYSLISMSFIGVFLGIILWNDSLSIFSFPINFYNFINESINGDKVFTLEVFKKLILPLSFYILTIRLLIKLGKRKRVKK